MDIRYDLAIIEKQRLKTSDVISTIEAIRFLSRNRFLTYIRGPLRNAIAMRSEQTVKVKQSTNFSGAKTIAPSINTLKNPKRAPTANAMPAYMQLLSLLRQLNILSHPYGSGSLRPSTKFFAQLNLPPIFDDTLFSELAVVFYCSPYGFYCSRSDCQVTAINYCFED